MLFSHQLPTGLQ